VRAALTTLAEVLGIGLVAAGFWSFRPGLGLIAAGLGLILIGWRTA
jgi:hypothetical protein